MPTYHRTLFDPPEKPAGDRGRAGPGGAATAPARRRRGPARSKAAAAAAVDVPTVLARVEAELRFAGQRGATDEELLDAFSGRGDFHKESTLRARRVELVNAGSVVDSGRTRRTRAGVDATVWVWAAGHDVTTAPGIVPLPPGIVRRTHAPCRKCGSWEWNYPAHNAPAPAPRRVTCAGCGLFIGYEPENGPDAA